MIPVLAAAGHRKNDALGGTPVLGGSPPWLSSAIIGGGWIVSTASCLVTSISITGGSGSTRWRPVRVRRELAESVFDLLDGMQLL